MSTLHEPYDLSEGLAFQVGHRNLGIDYRLQDQQAEEQRRSMSAQHTPYDAAILRLIDKQTKPIVFSEHGLAFQTGAQEGYRQCVVDYAPLLEAAKAVRNSLEGDIAFTREQLTTKQKRELLARVDSAIAAAEGRNT